MHGRQARVQSDTEKAAERDEGGQVQLKKVRERGGDTVRERERGRERAGTGTGCQPVWIIMTRNLSAFVYIVVRLPQFVCVRFVYV